MLRSGLDEPIDVRVARLWWTRPGYESATAVGVLIVVVGVAYATISSAASLVGIESGVVAGLVMGGAASVIATTVTNRRVRRARRVGDRISLRALRGESSTLQTVIAEEVATGGASLVRSALARVAQNLCSSGWAGLVVRCLTEFDSPPEALQPIVVPFEPIPLDESEASCRELAASPATEADIDCAASGEALSPARAPVLGGHYARELRWPTLMGLRLFMTVGFLFVLILHLKGISTSRWVLFATFVAGPFALVLGFMPRGSARQTWVFPGGIAVPAHAFRRGWRIVRRSEGALIAYPSQGTLAVVTPDGVKLVHGTRGETELALRAWFSPVPPPTDEQLREFFA